MILSTDCKDYLCNMSRVIWGSMCQLHRNTSIMYNIVALYHGINVHLYSEDDDA